MIERILAFSLALLTISNAHAEGGVAAFYTGRQIRIVVGSSAGGGYDIISRAMAQYIGKYVPGHPSVVVENEPGAGSLVMTNKLYNLGPQDGTAIGAAINGMPTAPLLSPEAAHFDVAKINWIGSTNREIQAVMVWHTAPVQSLADLMNQDLIIGAASAGTATLDFPLVSNAIIHTRFKITRGYEGTPQINQAMENGEIQGNGGIGWTSIKTQSSAWLASDKIKVIAQYGLERLADLKDVPTFMEMAKTEADRQALRLVFARQEYGRPYFVPPQVPPDRVAALRHAFDATMRDPGFLAETKKLQLDIDPMSGEEVAELVVKVSSTPPDIIARVRAALDGDGK